MRVEGKLTTASRWAWELANGPLPSDARVLSCPDEPACVRIEHLRLDVPRSTSPRPNTSQRGRQGGGSLREVRPGIWELAVSAGRFADGTPRRLFKSVHANGKREAVAELAGFVTEVQQAHQAETKELRDLTVDEAVERFLDEYLRVEKGREEKTIADYRKLHSKWFSPTIGTRRLRDVDEATIDRLFGAMRSAGLSRSRLNQGKSLYSPLFRWAKRRGIVARNPMLEFQLPTSRQVTHQRTPPEVDQLCLLLRSALEVVPEVASVLALGAVTGMRRGELVGVRRSRVGWGDGRITVDAAVSETKQVKGTKTRIERSFFVDDDTMAMLRRHCAEMDERAASSGAVLGPDAFVFSLALDCSVPMPPDLVTKRVAVLKAHLGIEDKRPETIALEDEALRLRRAKPVPRAAGRTGPLPDGGLSFREIGRQLGKSDRWAAMAVAAAQRREAARSSSLVSAPFDGSILALRKFTSSELLDAGFNISMVAQRQGHGAGVLAKHYAKSRRSSDRQAAEHLGRVVHGAAPSHDK